MFKDEEDWLLANDIAKSHLDLGWATGELELPAGRRRVAEGLIRAMVRALGTDPDADVTELPGVTAEAVESKNVPEPSSRGATDLRIAKWPSDSHNGEQETPPDTD